MVPCVVALVLIGSQPRPLRRSYVQIIAMGRERWRKVVEREDGTSRAQYRNGEWSYGEAAAWRNDRVLALMGKAAYRPLVRDLRAFGRCAVEVGDATDGGGTAWATVWCETHADLEEALGTILKGHSRSKPSTTAAVERRMRELEVVVERAMARSSGDGLGLYIRGSERKLKALKASWKALNSDGRRMPRALGASRTCCLALLDKVVGTR